MDDALVLASELVLAVFAIVVYSALWFRQGSRELDRLLRDEAND